MVKKYFIPKNKNSFVPKANKFRKKYHEFFEWSKKGAFAGALVGTATLPFSIQPLISLPFATAVGTATGATIGGVREIYIKTGFAREIYKNLKRKKRKKR